MTLSGLLDVVLTDPALARVSPRPAVRLARPHRAAGAAPVRRRRARGRRRPRRRRPAGARGHRDRPGGRGPGRRAALPAARRTRSSVYPAWETLPHERLSPAHRHRRPPAGRAAPARPPRRRRPGDRPGPGRRRAGPRACCSRRSPGLGDLEPVALRAGDEADLDDVVERAGRRRLRPRRPGREARRVRRPRRHPRRLPAHRGAPAAGRVLGRRGRGDPLLRGRRPALARGRRARAVGAAVPRAAAHRRRSASGPPRWPPSTRSWPRCSDKLAEGIAVEGMESLAPVLVDGMELLLDRAAGRARTCWSATRSGSAPGPPTWSRTKRGVPRRRPGRRRPAAARRRSTSARRRCRDLADVRRPRRASWACRGGRSAPFAADERAATTSDDRSTRHARPRGATAATPPRALGRRQGLARRRLAGRRCVIEGHGPAQRAVERARARPTSAPAGRRRRRPRPSRGRRARHLRLPGDAASSPRRRGWRVLTETDLTGQRGTVDAGTCAGCRAGGATPSTRCSCSPATSSCTSSTASAATSRWCSAPCNGADPRVPGHRVRARQARPARRPALRPDRPARPAHPLRRRRGTRRCTSSAAPTGRRPRAGPARRSRRSPPS